MTLPLKIVAVVSVVGAALTAVGTFAPRAVDSTALVVLPAASFEYRVAGDFLDNAVSVNPPLTTVSFDRPVAIMKDHVSRAEYQRCVEAAVCKPIAAPVGRDADVVPAVGVSWYDAVAYAAWLSRETGHRYRLPTDAEWAYAAGALFHDNTLVEDGDAANPARRWLATYESQAASEKTLDSRPQPFGTYGINANGLADVAGNVWDWTSTCFMRRSTSDRGPPTETESCGVRVVEGAHRTYLTDFVRDPKGGACSVGTPPSNLGIRLVRDADPTIADRFADFTRRLSPLGI